LCNPRQNHWPFDTRASRASVRKTGLLDARIVSTTLLPPRPTFDAIDDTLAQRLEDEELPRKGLGRA